MSAVNPYEQEEALTAELNRVYDLLFNQHGAPAARMVEELKRTFIYAALSEAYSRGYNDGRSDEENWG